jgi:cadmium resistance protein CadD (predicted permease)
VGEIGLALGLGVVLFVSTNLDDIFVLLALFAGGSFRPAQVVLGQLTGIGALFALSAAGAALSLVAPRPYLGLLGFAPLALGLLGLARGLRGEPEEEEEEAPAPRRSAGILAVALVTIANGGDNLGVYIPVFATRRLFELLIFAVVFAVMTGLWCAAGYYLVHHPRLGAPIRRYARPLTPLVLIGLGLYILIEAGSYALLGL